MSQEGLIEKIRTQGNEALAMVYENYRDEFLLWITKEFKCSLDDSKDIYQLTIMIFYDNVRTGKLLNLVSSVKTYLFGIGKNLARERQRKEKRIVPIAKEKWLKEYLIDEPEEQLDEGLFALARVALEKLGQPCQRIVELFYFEKKNMTEISEALGYKNPDTAKNQKCKCMARLRKLFSDETSRQSTYFSHEPH
ncbi:sigma-70 family RNA polymerase sigma factor [Chryseolinea sp. T2]|uniref:RNA polymerase sigma factor n=1 Tax=Chryseolinea sp. T2 TaxID=3129255 RepID=UPI0030777C54